MVFAYDIPPAIVSYAHLPPEERARMEYEEQRFALLQFVKGDAIFFDSDVFMGFDLHIAPHNPNLQHFRGSRTRWQKGVASFFG